MSKINLNLSVYQLCKEFNKNRGLIKAYLKGDTIEHGGDGLVAGMTVGVFLLAFAIGIGIFIWSIWALIHYSPTMPTWAIIVCILLYIFTFGGASIIVLIIVYVTKNMGKGGKLGI